MLIFDVTIIIGIEQLYFYKYLGNLDEFENITILLIYKFYIILTTDNAITSF